MRRDALKNLLAEIKKSNEDGTITEMWPTPPPPLHANCRCVIVDEIEATVVMQRTSDGKWAVPKALRGGTRGKQK